MEKRLKDYLEYARRMSEAGLSKEEKRLLHPKMLQQISFFQHERLVHLIVTMTFAIMAILSMAASVTTGSLPLLGLFAAFLVLLVPYIRHYFILENGVQKLYEYYDRIYDNWR